MQTYGLPEWIFISSLIVLSGCGLSHDTASIDQYNDFAILSAKSKLWNEAIFRWNQILNIDPQNPKAHNNLGVAYEALGEIDNARDSYEHANRFGSGNRYYRFNYRKYRLNTKRNEKTPSDESEQENDPEVNSWDD